MMLLSASRSVPTVAILFGLMGDMCRTVAMTEANFKATTENERMRYSLSQIELMAEEIMDVRMI